MIEPHENQGEAPLANLNRVENTPDCFIPTSTVNRLLTKPAAEISELVYLGPEYGHFQTSVWLAERTRHDKGDGALIIQGTTESGHAADLKLHPVSRVKKLANLAFGRPRQSAVDIRIYKDPEAITF